LGNKFVLQLFKTGVDQHTRFTDVLKFKTNIFPLKIYLFTLDKILSDFKEQQLGKLTNSKHGKQQSFKFRPKK
jgi:hypothetical protein